MKEELSFGSVNISKEVIAIIAGVAAQEVEGVARVGESISSFIRLVSGIPIGRGIKVDLNERDIYVRIPIYVKQNVFFPDVAREVQTHVKEVLESMTGLNVLEVNVIVKGVILGKKDKEEENK